MKEKADIKLETIAESKELEVKNNLPEVDSEMKSAKLLKIKDLAGEHFKAEKKYINMSNAVKNYQENSIRA